MSESIKIPKSVIDEFVADSKDAMPNEGCGYLVGIDDTVHQFYKMTNLDAKPDHFSFDPKEQFKVVKQARNDGYQILSVYHSHPSSPARLSDEDYRLLKDHSVIYIIVSMVTGKFIINEDIKAYRITGEHRSDFIPIELI